MPGVRLLCLPLALLQQLDFVPLVTAVALCYSLACRSRAAGDVPDDIGAGLVLSCLMASSYEWSPGWSSSEWHMIVLFGIGGKIGHISRTCINLHFPGHYRLPYRLY